LAKVKKVRRRRQKGTGTKMYFNKDTQAAIIQYQDCDDPKERESLYVKEILPAFDRLSENLIFIYGFAKGPDPVDNLKNDCVTFLYEAIGKWDPAKGSKAFSYFNVVAKNWLIINSRRNYKRISRHVSVDDLESMSSQEKHSMSNYDISPPPDDFIMREERHGEIMKMLHEIQRRVTGDKEKRCITAVITVFKNIDSLDFLNKRAVFVYVRDISGLSPKQLSVAMNSIRKQYKLLVKDERLFDIF